MFSDPPVLPQDPGAGPFEENLPLTDGATLPLDIVARATFPEIITEAGQVYLMQGDNLEHVTPVSSGSYLIMGGKEIIVVENDDRLFIAPESDCLLEFLGSGIRIRPAEAPVFNAFLGITFHVSAAIPGTPSMADLFNCISSLCQVPGEESVLRSYPFFRRPLRIHRLGEGDSTTTRDGYRSNVTFSLPADLRYLYAAAPLAYYAGAGIQISELPAIQIAGNVLPLPSDAHEFEQWACNMLGYVFHAECAARYMATTGKLLAGVYPSDDPVMSPGKLASMGIEDRLLAYFRAYGREPVKQTPWHTASYIDPVPQSIELVPSLMQSLSSIFYPSRRGVNEREVVEMEVRQFLSTKYRSGEAIESTSRHTVLPGLENALIHQWFSDGYPIDAIKQLSSPGNTRLSARPTGQIPRIAIVCNESKMFREVIALRNFFRRRASLTLLQNISHKELEALFSCGYDIVHYIGHCDHRGFKCNGGYTDLSSVQNNNTPLFFFNSCFSYSPGAKLLDKGSICGISTLYKIIEEDAVDISLNFYRLLSEGYPVLLAYFGAKECSVLGKEYIFLGNGLTTVFGKRACMPIYKLVKLRYGYSLSCITASKEKGFIYCSGQDRSPGLADFGAVLENLPLCRLMDGLSLPDGACIFNGKIYDSINEAVLSNIEDSPAYHCSSCLYSH